MVLQQGGLGDSRKSDTDRIKTDGKDTHCQNKGTHRGHIGGNGFTELFLGLTEVHVDDQPQIIPHGNDAADETVYDG